MKYGWGVDGLGRQHVCLVDGRDVLMCALPGAHALECIELLIDQEEGEFKLTQPNFSKGNEMEIEQMIEVFGNVDPAVLSGQAVDQACVWLAENDKQGFVYGVFNEEYQRRANGEL